MQRPGLGPLAALLIASAVARAAGAESTFAAEAGVLYDSNLTRAQYAADVRSDFAARIGAEAGQLFVPTGDDTIHVAAFARADAYRRYDGLDNVVLGAFAALRHKFAVGSDAPWLRIAIEGSHDEFKDSLRDSNRLAIDAEIGMRVTPAFDASAGVRYDRRYDHHGESLVPGIPGTVFDLTGFGGYARAGYTFNDIVYGGLRFGVRRGDVESTAQQSLPIFLASSAIAADPVFGSDDLFAYRLRGTTWSGATTASFALDPHASLNVSYLDERTYSPYGNQYKNRLVALTLAYQL